jgi:uncharacterized protein YceK
MNKITTIAVLCLVSGCASVTPRFDAKFGEAVRGALLAQTLHPQAAANPDLVQGLDGRSAVNALERYQDSFKTPPKTLEVINIGGALTGN